MPSKYLKNFIVQADEDIATSLWIAIKSIAGTVCVVDENNKFIGVLGRSDFPVYHQTRKKLKAGDVCNRNCKFLLDDENVYLKARQLFAQRNDISMSPVLNSDGILVDIVFRFQAFYEDFFGPLQKSFLFTVPYPSHVFLPPHVRWEWFPHMGYAYSLWRAAALAEGLGCPKISVIEFGVAGGSGLMALELHAKAIARLSGVDMEVYGFDSGEGLLPPKDYRDIPYMFHEGAFQMGDPGLLEERLLTAKLVLGDVSQTSTTFFEKYKPAPIGAMFVDVDHYQPTVGILKMFDLSKKYFMPRVQMRFDDIAKYSEYTGESLAIKEFNQSHDSMKISPEATTYPTYTGDANQDQYNSMITYNKECHLFEHPNYNSLSKHVIRSNTVKALPLKY